MIQYFRSFGGARFLFMLVPIAISLGFISAERLFGDGRDYLAYILIYSDVRLYDAFDVLRFEPGFVIASWFSKYALGLDFRTFYAILASVSLLVKFSIFNKGQRPVLTILFYLCCWYPLHEYTQIRAAVAIALCFLALEFYLQRRFIYFGVMISLATSFHASALILAVAIPGAQALSTYRLRVTAVAAAGLSVVTPILISPIVDFAAYFNPLVYHYAFGWEGDDVNVFSGTNILTLLLMTSILVADSLRDSRDRTFFILALMGLAAAIAFQSIPVFSFRMKELMLVFLVPLAFKAKLTTKHIPQHTSAVMLSIWSMYSYLGEGVIGDLQ